MVAPGVLQNTADGRKESHNLPIFAVCRVGCTREEMKSIRRSKLLAYCVDRSLGQPYGWNASRLIHKYLDRVSAQ